MAAIVTGLTLGGAASAEGAAEPLFSSAEGPAPSDSAARAEASSEAVDPSRSWLAHPSGKSAASSPPSQDPPGPWTGALGALAALAALGGLAYLVRAGTLRASAVVPGKLRVLSSVRVGPKSYVALVGVGERALLVGSTDQVVRRLAWVELESSPASVSELESPPASDAGFAGVFGRLLSVGSAGPKKSGVVTASTAKAIPAAAAGGGPTAERPAPPLTADPRSLLTPSGLLGSPRASGGRAHGGESSRGRRKPEAGAADAVAGETRDVVEWSPRARREPPTETPPDTAPRGEEAPSAESAARVEVPRAEVERRAESAERALEVEEQAKGLVRRGRRRAS